METREPPVRRRLYSVPDVCFMTDLGRSFILNEIKEKRLRSILCGRRRLVTEDALAAYIAEREADARQAPAP